MKAPDKICIRKDDTAPFGFTRHWIYTTKVQEHDIEYIRKDVFIDKACLWLKDNIDRYLYNTGGIDEYIPKCGGKMFEDFKKAMEE